MAREKEAAAPIDAAARARIDASVANAESATSAEIVVGLSRRSGTYRHAPYVAGLFGALTALAVYSAIWWLQRRTWPVAPVDVFLGVAALGYALFAALSLGPKATRLFVGDDERFEACSRAAEELFVASGVAKTKARNGVLLFVSLFERVVLVRGDDAVTAKLPESIWRETVEEMIERLSRNDVEGALIHGVQKLGALLKDAFPRDPADENELPDRLVVV
jgi:putative membrane protein